MCAVAPGGSAVGGPGPVPLVVPPGAADSVVNVGGPLTSLRKFRRSKSQANGALGSLSKRETVRVS